MNVYKTGPTVRVSREMIEDADYGAAMRDRISTELHETLLWMMADIPRPKSRVTLSPFHAYRPRLFGRSRNA